MIALLLLLAAEAPDAGERLLVRASARIARGETVSPASAQDAPGRQRNLVMRTSRRSGARETLVLVEFQ